MIRRELVVALTLWASASVACVGPFGGSSKTPQADGLPFAAREELVKKWDKTWKPAAVEAQATSCRPGEAAPPMVSADFDNDTLKDFALAVQTPEGVRLVALLARGKEFKLVDVDELGKGEATSFLGLEKRGVKFVDPGSAAEDYFSSETLATYRCGSPSRAYIWSGSSFRRVELKRP
jgi:hypothetical protein